MTATDPALTALAQGWCALSALHGRIEAPTAVLHGRQLPQPPAQLVPCAVSGAHVVLDLRDLLVEPG
ncbi:hypothetical protein, partial [Methylobacterium organophilum]|uniref:hypothetical protein n=1 Tax=Methylobacterium organophilum TaxID=410 RepID=UPI001EE239B7